eukprot:6457923-Alexandrium_andersonii.AAC.1
MSASLVGSEMCIRDSAPNVATADKRTVPLVPVVDPANRAPDTTCSRQASAGTPGISGESNGLGDRQSRGDRAARGPLDPVARTKGGRQPKRDPA